MTDRHQQRAYPLRMSDDLRSRLDSEAQSNGRSLNAEVTRRLEASFQTTSLWLPQSMLALVERSAKESGRSFDDEVRHRIEASYLPWPADGDTERVELTKQLYRTAIDHIIDHGEKMMAFVVAERKLIRAAFKRIKALAGSLGKPLPQGEWDGYSAEELDRYLDGEGGLVPPEMSPDYQPVRHDALPARKTA